MGFKKITKRLAQQLFGAIAFYTTIPISARWTLDFSRIARWSPFVGLLIGAILALSDILLQSILPILLRSVVVVMVWIAMTGALHLDGAMDTADGLGVWDPKKRLEVMADSRSGAFGVIAAIAIVLLKVTALTALSAKRWVILLWVPVWGRWAHVWAVGQYVYLRPQGKAQMHHDEFQRKVDYIPGLMLQGLICLGMWSGGVFPELNELLQWIVIASIVSWGIGCWFNFKFKGVTGDIHGAIVEWSETALLVAWVSIL